MTKIILNLCYLNLHQRMCEMLRDKKQLQIVEFIFHQIYTYFRNPDSHLQKQNQLKLCKAKLNF